MRVTTLQCSLRSPLLSWCARGNQAGFIVSGFSTRTRDAAAAVIGLGVFFPSSAMKTVSVDTNKTMGDLSSKPFFIASSSSLLPSRICQARSLLPFEMRALCERRNDAADTRACVRTARVW